MLDYNNRGDAAPSDDEQEKPPERLAQGESHKSVAADQGVTRQRVSQIAQENRDLIQRRQDELRLRVIERTHEELDEMLDGLTTSVKDPANRNGPQAMRAMNEAMGLTAKAQIHVGDVNVAGDVNVDARSVVVPPDSGELRRRLAELEDSL